MAMPTTRGEGADVTIKLQRSLALACGFGLMRAVTSNAYITAFGAESGTSLGFVAKTEFSLMTNGFSVLCAVAVVAALARLPRGDGLRAIPLACAAVAALVLAASYVASVSGRFAALPPVVGHVVAAAAYAVGMMVLTVAWFERFAAEGDARLAVHTLVGGYLVQAGAYLVLSYLAGWALCGVCSAALAASVGVLAWARRRTGLGPTTAVPALDAGAPVPAGLRPLRVVLGDLSNPLLCVSVLTAVVGLLHTSVIGNDIEYVVGGVPMAEALALATVLLTVVVAVSRRVPETSTVYRLLFPVMLVALSLLPFVTGMLGHVSGLVMVVCYDLVGMAFVLLLLETSHSCAAPPAALMGVYQGVTQLSLVVGLVLGIALSRVGADAGASYLTLLILVCIYLLAMVPAVLLRRARRAGLGTDGGSALPSTIVGVVPDGAADAAEEERHAQQIVRERVGRRVEAYASARGLTPREAQVMARLARGHTAAAIADELGMAENTAWAHIKRIYAKLGVHGKQELIELVEREVIEGGIAEANKTDAVR